MCDFVGKDDDEMTDLIIGRLSEIDPPLKVIGEGFFL